MLFGLDLYWADARNAFSQVPVGTIDARHVSCFGELAFVTLQLDMVPELIMLTSLRDHISVKIVVLCLTLKAITGYIYAPNVHEKSMNTYEHQGARSQATT
jgi:hypothetical protein